MNNFDLQYQALLRDVLINGTNCSSRSLQYRQRFGQVTQIDLRDGFPLSTLRAMPWKAIVDETLFDLSGSSQLEDMGRAKKWWSYLADESGHIEYTYGNSWRHAWGDQFSRVVEQLSYNATSRQIVLQTYQPGKTVLCPPCHTQIIFSSDGINLDMMVVGRSNDLNCGYPGDVARYALIQSLIANFVDLEARYFCMPCANNHIYHNGNIEHSQELLKRDSLPLPVLIICGKPNPLKPMEYGIDFSLINYQSRGLLKPNF